MKQGLIFYPCLALILLTLFALYAMFRGRMSAVRSGEVSAAYFKTYDTGEKLPRKARQAERLFHNLQESTPIFYFLCVAAMALEKVDMIFVAMAWLYVLSRALQSYVHLTVNKLGPRSKLYLLSWIVMVAFGVRLALLV